MTNNDTFTALDFETAQGYRWSICQVGIVRVENGKIVDEVNLLVQPPNNYYWERFTEIHGIAAHHTTKSPTFDLIWNQIKSFIEHQNVIAQSFVPIKFINQIWLTCAKNTTSR